jgi:hypothetical protein
MNSSDENALSRLIARRSLVNALSQPQSPLSAAASDLGLGFLSLLSQQTAKRRVFFSFHYADIMRVNNVRMCGEFLTDQGRKIEGFYDGSLWERRKLDGPESIKNLIREGVQNSSAICVLIGSETWVRPWVRYEIARAVIDGRGLLAAHINSINHHQLRVPHLLGPNPLNYMGVGKVQDNALRAPRYLLYEQKTGWNGFGWYPYDEHTRAVDRPIWLPDPWPNHVMPLGAGAPVYDFVGQDGFKNIGAWIDAAAKAAGR